MAFGNSISLHFKVGLIIRLMLILYGELQDKYFQVAYTDADYNVFTEAARYITFGDSPYNEQTFRYSPLFAYLALPNIYVHPTFGKFLFAIADTLLGIAIYSTVKTIYGNANKANQCAVLWLYNPISIVISTRGNADSLSSALVLSTVFLHLNDKYLYSGLLLGLCVHLRLYPIIFLLPLYLSAGDVTFEKVYRQFVFPMKPKLIFIFGFISSIVSLTAAFYLRYGNLFLQQSILYHISRVDTRHNFSVYFYLNYLNFAEVPNTVQKFLPLCLQGILILSLALKYAEMRHLPFCMFCIAFVFVSFNKVITFQYYIWYLSLLPLFLPSISLAKKKVIYIISAWTAIQSLWLYNAYKLEFAADNTFFFIWTQSVILLILNVYIGISFIRAYNESTFGVKRKFL